MKNEILLANYWEHFKLAKDFAQVYPVGHYKRKRIEDALNDIQKELHLNSLIKRVAPAWKDVDVDKFMDEVR